MLIKLEIINNSKMNNKRNVSWEAFGCGRRILGYLKRDY